MQDELWDQFEEEMAEEELGAEEEEDISAVLDAPLPPTTALPKHKTEGGLLDALFATFIVK